MLFVSPAAEAQKRIALVEEGLRVGHVSDPVFSPDSRIVAVLHTGISGVSERDLPRAELSRVSIWDVASRQRIQSLECRKPGGSYLIPRLAFSPDGSLLALAELDGHLRLWNTTSGEATTAAFPAKASAPSSDGVPTAPPECTGVAFSPDGGCVAVLCDPHAKDEPHVVWIHDVKQIQPPALLTLDGLPAAIAWQSSDRLALVVNNVGTARHHHAELQEWTLHSTPSAGSPPALASRKSLGESAVWGAFSAKAQALAFTTGANIALLDLRNGQFTQHGTFGDWHGSRVRNYRAGVTALAFSPDGSMLAVGGNSDQTHTRLRLLALHSQLFDFDPDAFDHGPGYAVTNVAFAPSGEYLATAVHRWTGSGEPLFLWDLSSKAD